MISFKNSSQYTISLFYAVTLLFKCRFYINLVTQSKIYNLAAREDASSAAAWSVSKTCTGRLVRSQACLSVPLKQDVQLSNSLGYSALYIKEEVWNYKHIDNEQLHRKTWI